MDPSAPCKTYVFPGSAAAELHAKNKARGHFRSASHGGTSLTNPSVTRAPTNSAAIDLLEAAAGIEKASQDNVPQAKPGGILRHGHTRALSQGQIPSQQGHQKGHARTGSKTDFVLPAGHQDKDTPTHHRQASRTQSAEAFQRSHSRQASRTESIYTLRPTRIPWSNRLFFWKKSPAPQMPRMRTIVPNHLVPPRTKAKNHPNRSYADNCIRTSKYTFLSFLPKNLLEQFHRFANLYFLFIVLLNWIPAVNAFGKEVAMIPVIFVLGVTAIKDAYEDHRRHRSDKRINGTTCRVYSREQDRYVRVRFDQLRVGDIVHLSCDEIIPADMLILRSSDEHGLCFIETSNLDGENNLKQRSVAPGMVSKQSEFDPKKFVSTLECEAPTTKIYQFNGAMVHPKGARVPLTRDNLLLRDCVLKNTDFVEGIVVYAGHESKAMLNHGGPRYKMTQLEQAMNLDVVWCVVILVLLCLSGACGCGLWLNWYVPLLPVPFLPLGDFGRPGEEPMSAVEPDPFYQAFLAFWTYVIILQVMIPLSLYVTIEMTKLAQVFHIQNDDELKDPVTGKQIECRALNITEELGQIQYVFSDKTGTLTENNMIFRRCSVGGIDYNHPQVGKAQPVGERQRITPNSRLEEVLRQFEMQRATEAETPEGERVFQLYVQARRLQEFFLLMAVCNTVVVAKHRHKDAMNESGVVEPAAEDMSTASLESGANSVSSTMVLVESADSLDCAPAVIQENVSATPKRSKIFSGRHSARYRPSNHMQQRPLSPIDSSCETTPTESPAPMRPRFLQLPTFASAQSFFMLRRSSTPTSDVSAVTPTEKKPLYEAESPDELALIDAACAYNIKLLQRSPHHVSVSVPGEGVLEFHILKVLPFDSTRKRMSVVLRHPQTHKIIIYCKGADSAIFPRLAYTRSFAENQIIAKTEQHVNQYAKQGLRTLLMAKRVLTEQEYNSWLELHQEAELAADSRERLLYESYCRLERELQLLGATGIEDKLQDGVPETISALRNAGIVVWVLTGDKQETAINIAYACSLFSGEMEVLKLNARSKSAAESAIHCYLDDIQRELAAAASAEETANRLRAFFPLASQGANILLRKRALVVDGKTLLYILDKRSNLQKPFLHLTRHCAAVLCCRATPLQKAFIVKIVKQQLRVRTLGIGDGANDVSMIQTADVGIGISGAEGMQAVMASDFAIPRFRFLHRLLLVHGHWCYDRLARMVLYFFYKNANFVFVIFWYQMYCGFSGNVMIDQLYLMFFNLFFTSLPPLAMGIYDQVAPAEILSSEPPLYAASREGRHYRSHSFWVNIADALYQSTVIFFIAYFAYNESEVDLWEFGTVITTCCIFVMVLHIAMDFRSWTWLHGASVLLSIVLFLAFALAYNAVCVDCSGLPNPYWVMQHCMTTPIFWTVLLLVCVLSMIPRFVAKALSAVLGPSEVMKSLLNHRSRQRNKGELTVAWSRNSTTLTVVHTTETGTTLAQS